MEPKLLIIKNDGTGSELLSEGQLSNYLRMKQNDSTTKRFEMEKLLGMENSKAISYLTKATKEHDYLDSLSFINGIEIPRIIDNLPQSIVLQKSPPLQVFRYRRLLEHPPLDSQKRETFNKDMERYTQWKAKLDKTHLSLDIADSRSPAEHEEEKQLQALILSQRRGKEKQEEEKEKGKSAKGEAKDNVEGDGESEDDLDLDGSQNKGENPNLESERDLEINKENKDDSFPQASSHSPDANANDTHKANEAAINQKVAGENPPTGNENVAEAKGTEKDKPALKKSHEGKPA